MGVPPRDVGTVEECLPGEPPLAVRARCLDSLGVAAIHNAEDGYALVSQGSSWMSGRLLLGGRGQEAGGVGRFDARRNHPFEEEILDAAPLVELDERFVRSPRGGTR